MSKMEEYWINLMNVRSREELHEELKQTLALPPYYGGTLDALYDALSEVRGRISVSGYAEAEKTLAEYARGFRKVCEDAAAGNTALQIVFDDGQEGCLQPDYSADAPDVYDAFDIE